MHVSGWNQSSNNFGVLDNKPRSCRLWHCFAQAQQSQNELCLSNLIEGFALVFFRLSLYRVPEREARSLIRPLFAQGNVSPLDQRFIGANKSSATMW